MPLPPVAWPSLGWQVIDWMEAMLCHGPGDVQGDDLIVDDEIALHICWLYRVWPQDHRLAGRRLLHHGVLSRPKGRAKSETAGALVCAEALGPVRCDGFDANGQPVGVPVTYPFIRCLATEEEQAGHTYDNAKYMLEHGEAHNAYSVDTGLSRCFILEPGGGEIRPSTAASASKEGGKETFAVEDETHLYNNPELRRMNRTVARNTGKRKIAEPWIYDTTTSWVPGERSVAEQTFAKYGHLDPELSVTKHGVLIDHRQGDEPKRFYDDRSLAKAIRSGYGPAAEWMDVPRIVKIIRQAEDQEDEAYRYWLNRPRVGKEQWMAPDVILACLGTVEVDQGDPITLGFDGSETDDHTALMGCTESGDLFTIGVWTPTAGDDGWRTEVHEVVDWCYDHFRVVRHYNDPPWWNGDIATWASRHGSPPVTEWWTNVDSKMAAACGTLRTVLTRGEATLDPIPVRTEPQTRDGKALVHWHFENARKRKVKIKFEDTAEEAFVVRKVRPGSPLKIDAVTSSVLARRARDDAMKNGEFEFQEPVYDSAVW